MVRYKSDFAFRNLFWRWRTGRLLPAFVEMEDVARQRLIDGWKRMLTVAKRHTGKASRSEPVVRARCTLLQKMLDELVALPEVASSTALVAFLSVAQ